MGVFATTRHEKSSVFSPVGPRTRSTAGAGAQVTGSTRKSSSSTPSVSARPNLLATHGVDGPAGGLPRVVRRARAEAPLVGDDPRVAADLLRTLCVPEQVRVVALLPDEDQVRRRHVVGDVRAADGRAGERVGADAVPAGAIVVGVVLPELALLLEQLVLEEEAAGSGLKRTRLGRLHAQSLVMRPRTAAATSRWAGARARR